MNATEGFTPTCNYSTWNPDCRWKIRLTSDGQPLVQTPEGQIYLLDAGCFHSDPKGTMTNIQDLKCNILTEDSDLDYWLRVFACPVPDGSIAPAYLEHSPLDAYKITK